MVNAGVLTFREFAMHEPLPLFPGLKRLPGPVLDCLQAAGAAPEVLAAWQRLVAQQFRPEEHGACP